MAAYEALMEIIKNSPTDCYTTVQKTTLIVLERLNQVLVMGGQMQNHSERGEMTDLQSLLCATLQVSFVKSEANHRLIVEKLIQIYVDIFQSVLIKVTPEDAPKISDQIMAALLQMFMSNSNQAGDVHEEAMRAVTSLIEILGTGFVKYMDSFKPFLLAGLKNHLEYQVLQIPTSVQNIDYCRTSN